MPDISARKPHLRRHLFTSVDKYPGQIMSEDGQMKQKITGRIGLAYAAFRSIDKKGIWRDNLLSRRTKVTMYKVNVLAILLDCSETSSIGPEHIKSSKQHKRPSYAVFVEISLGG
jgi:hypothetical protein